MDSLMKYTSLAALIICLGILLTVGPKKAAVFINNKAVAQYNQGKVQEAIDLYTKSLKFHPDAQIYYNLACAYDAENQIDKAIENYKNSLSLDPNSIQSYKALAEIYREKKDFAQAEIYLNKINEFEKTDSDQKLKELKTEQLITLCNQAIADYKQNNIQAAVNGLKKAIALDRNYAPAHKILGEIYYSQNDLSKAIGCYNAAIRANDHDPLIYSNIGIMYMKLENYTQAVKFLQKANKLDPDNLDIQYSLASVLRDSGQPDKAVALYKQIVAISPQYQNIHNDIAGIYQSMGLEEDAQLEFNKAKIAALNLKAAGDTQLWTSLSLAIAFDGLNETEKAKNIIDKLIAENPDFSHAYYIRAQILKKAGQKSQAKADIGKARTLARKIKPMPIPKSVEKKPEIKQTVDALKIDTVIKLKNGQTMKGKLKKQTDTYIILEMDMGSSVGAITFSKQKIAEIIKSE